MVMIQEITSHDMKFLSKTDLIGNFSCGMNFIPVKVVIKEITYHYRKFPPNKDLFGTFFLW